MRAITLYGVWRSCAGLASGSKQRVRDGDAPSAAHYAAQARACAWQVMHGAGQHEAHLLRAWSGAAAAASRHRLDPAREVVEMRQQLVKCKRCCDQSWDQTSTRAGILRPYSCHGRAGTGTSSLSSRPLGTLVVVQQLQQRVSARGARVKMQGGGGACWWSGGSLEGWKGARIRVALKCTAPAAESCRFGGARESVRDG